MVALKRTNIFLFWRTWQTYSVAQSTVLPRLQHKLTFSQFYLRCKCFVCIPTTLEALSLLPLRLTATSPTWGEEFKSIQHKMDYVIHWRTLQTTSLLAFDTRFFLRTLQTTSLLLLIPVLRTCKSYFNIIPHHYKTEWNLSQFEGKRTRTVWAKRVPQFPSNKEKDVTANEDWLRDVLLPNKKTNDCFIRVAGVFVTFCGQKVYKIINYI